MRARSLYPSVCAVALLVTTAAAQDLQPGRNFGGASTEFGADRSENVDVGDIDNDGDLDVLVGNGGDGGAQWNRIFVNQGGLQAGTIGSFVQEQERWTAGVKTDRTRDVEFVDVEADGDLDIYVSNRGGAIRGEVSRFYDNLGGAQGGTIGFYAENNDVRWGQLLSVPAEAEVPQPADGQGPFRDWSCDCDFADTDLDGDLDLFHSSYGPSISGNQPSRLFLNDGGGVFDELFPWSDGDIELHTLDIDLADFDGDLDIDVMASSRDSQARFYVNNQNEPVGAQPFSDVTADALLAGGVVQQGNNNYEAEFADIDGDDDFDVWFKNLSGNEDKIGRNDGPLAGIPRFSIFDNLVNDVVVDENEVDFLDYDADGDLDAFAANFSGTNWLYRNTLAQVGAGAYEFRRTDSTGEPPELPTIGNGGTTLDGEAADLDNDGDEELLLANDGGQPNWLFENTLGVPDTTAPTFAQLEQVADKPLGDDARVIAQVRDNSAYYIIGYYDVDLVYTVNGGAEVRVDMASQGGQQFVGFVPGSLNGCIDYRVEAVDWTGNLGVSQTLSFEQGTCDPGAQTWTDLGQGLAGTAGVPVLAGTGSLTPGSSNDVTLSGALAGASSTLVIGLSSFEAPFKGGVLVPSPDVLLGLPVDGAGGATLPFTWPAGVPSGTMLWWQWWIVDPAGPSGLAASNGLLSTSP